jgi:hypothetical protein
VDKVSEKEEKPPTIEGPSFVFKDDGKTIMLEEVYDPQDGFVGFAIWDGEKVRIADSYERGGIIYVPRLDEGMKKGVILLPNKAEDFENVGKLIEDIKAFCVKYLDVRAEFLEIAVWYVLLTWVHDRVSTIAYLRSMGDWGTGKSRFLDVVGGCCYRTMNASGATTAAAVSRLIESWGGTLILNEADWEKSDERQEIVRILNEGFEKSRAIIKAHQDKQKELIFYSPYGPKILATRKPFDDPALESRCLTEVMRETRREDIPPILTRKFKEEQATLRNKLLMFRFKNWDKVREETIEEVFPKLVGKLEPRLIQSTITFSTLFASDTELFNRFIAFLNGYQNDLKEQRAGTFEGLVVNAIYELGMEGHGIITAGDIATRIVINQGWEKPPDSRTVGKYFRALGIVTKMVKVTDESKTKTARSIVWDKEQLQRIIHLIRKYVSGEVTLVTFVTRVTKGIVDDTTLDGYLKEMAGECDMPLVTDVTNETHVTNSS